jgi:hypothetical protein
MSRRKAVTEISLGDELGHGHFGRVHAATMPPHGDVAVKVIDCATAARNFGSASWDALQQHLFAEADRLSAATHQNVVRVYSVSGAT